MFPRGFFCLLAAAVLLRFAAPALSQESPNRADRPALTMDDLLAWCIVPFDNKHRTPEQRIQMLQSLGFKAYAYDWRDEHLPTAVREFTLARGAQIEIVGVWLWIDGQTDRPGKLSNANERLFAVVEEAKLSTQYWVGFNPNFFAGATDAAAVDRGAAMVRYLSERAAETGGRVALYNHGGWLGDPRNQIRIIEALPERKVGIIYNFHHGHEHIDHFGELVEAMLPHLWAVNVNGMRTEGPKILPFGTGAHEQRMLDQLLAAGYEGPIGVLGHVEDADVADVLRRNVAGLLEK